MPWFVTPRLRFLHVPKTGGTWATDAICAAGVCAEHPPGSPAHLDLAQTSEYSDRFTIAFVRHPLEYWRSYWAFRMRTGWDLDSAFDDAVRSEDFVAFVERVIALAPGAAGALFEQFVGPEEAEVAFVGRHEQLLEDTCLALRLAGERFDERVLRGFPRVNATRYRAGQALYPRELAERLAAAESRAIQRFYPWEPVPERLVVGGRVPLTPDPLREQMRALMIQLRDARAELSATRARTAADARDLDVVRSQLRDAQTALAGRPRWVRAPGAAALPRLRAVAGGRRRDSGGT